MRKVKFRGYSVEKLCSDSQWIEGFGIHAVELTNGKTEYVLYTESGTYQVHEKSIGQYIDLTDGTRSKDIVDGIEIFEGDILWDPITNDFYIVTWDENYANFFLKNTKEEDLSKPDYDFAEYDIEVCNTLYIVGNTYENPEYLEEVE